MQVRSNPGPWSPHVEQSGAHSPWCSLGVMVPCQERKGEGLSGCCLPRSTEHSAPIVGVSLRGKLVIVPHPPSRALAQTFCPGEKRTIRQIVPTLFPKGLTSLVTDPGEVPGESWGEKQVERDGWI